MLTRKKQKAPFPLSVVEICAGGGGQALGLEQAGFRTACAVEIEAEACATLQLNRPEWNIVQGDVRKFDGFDFRGADLLAGGVPCPPFSIAGKQLGSDDERDLFPEALRLVREMDPAAVMLENVRGFASSKFDGYREKLLKQLRNLGYSAEFKLLNACDFGVPQLRPRFILVAVKGKYAAGFHWPEPLGAVMTVSEAIGDMVEARGWKGAATWRKRANRVAPTVVGGSRKHGGPDLGPTRAKREWAELGVDGNGIANEPPDAALPVAALIRLTIPMVARIQGFPDEWRLAGKKTAAYRQVGNAFPPPVARAVGHSIWKSLQGEKWRKAVAV